MGRPAHCGSGEGVRSCCRVAAKLLFAIVSMIVLRCSTSAGSGGSTGIAATRVEEQALRLPQVPLAALGLT